MLAAVVTHDPGPYLARHLAALAAQVDELVVIDNGSADFSAVEDAALEAGCRLIRNPANLGVAAALNQGARQAMAGGFPWLAAFDQDSLVADGAIASLLALYGRFPEPERIAVLAMSHRDRNTGRAYHRPFEVLQETADWRSLRATITSGSLIRVAAFDRVGMFDESLFIDCVDHDFCLRCRRKGLLIIEGKAPVLDHAIGEAKVRRLMGRRVSPTGHSPARRYYITRNGLEMSRRYARADPAWAAWFLVQNLGANLVSLIFEENRAAKAGAILQGAGHFLIRRFGPR